MKNFNLLLLSILCCSIISAQNAPGFSNLGNNKKAGNYISTRGIRLYYETYGSGEPLLFIHGNGGSIRSFSNQIPFFAENYQVIAVDSRAQGNSTDPSDSLSYEMMTDDINALLDSLKTGPCYVVGWSDGGINGLLLAIRHPDKVKKLAITGANLWPDTTAVDPYVANWALQYNQELAAKPMTASNKNELKLAHLLSYEPHIQTSQLAAIQCPALVIGGDHDVILPQHTMLIANSIPQSYLWILPGSGHATPIIYKDIFNMVVKDFFVKPFRKIEGLGRLE